MSKKDVNFSNVDQALMNTSVVNVFIIGLRGYTQNYGGWESFAQGLLNNWTDSSIHFFVFEKVADYSEEEIVEVKHVTCIRVFEKEQGSSAMMKYDKHCTDIADELILRNSIKNPILFHLGVRIGPYLWLKRNYLEKRGIKLMENPAGAEWRRTKWNKLVQAYLLVSAIMMAKSTDCMVCDNEGIRKLYDYMLIGRKPVLEYVAYGVNEVPRVPETMSQSAKNYFKHWNIEKDGYYLVLGRFIPENNYEMMIKGFIKSKTEKKLLIITNYKTEIQKFYQHILKSTKFETEDRVIMAGTLYDPDVLHYIRQNARGYIHGHSVGGTNPGLLEAMAETDVNILYNVNFNKFVGGESTLYFSDEDELASIIEKVDVMTAQERIEIGELSKYRMRKYYSWSYIVDEYNRVMHTIVGIEKYEGIIGNCNLLSDAKIY